MVTGDFGWLLCGLENMAVLNTEAALEAALKAVGVTQLHGAKLPLSVPLNSIFASVARTISDSTAPRTLASFLINRRLDVVPLGQDPLLLKSDGRVIKGTLVADFLRFAALHKLLTERWYQLAQLCIAQIQFSVSRAGLGNTIRAGVFKPTSMRHSLSAPRVIAQVKQTTYRHLCIESRELSPDVFKWFAAELVGSDELELSVALRLRSFARRADLPALLSCLSGHGIARGSALCNRDLIDGLLDDAPEVANDSGQRLALAQIIERVLRFENLLPHQTSTMPVRQAELDSDVRVARDSTPVFVDVGSVLHDAAALKSDTLGAAKGTEPLRIERQRPRDLLVLGCPEPSGAQYQDRESDSNAQDTGMPLWAPSPGTQSADLDMIFGELELE